MNRLLHINLYNTFLAFPFRVSLLSYMAIDFFVVSQRMTLYDNIPSFGLNKNLFSFTKSKTLFLFVFISVNFPPTVHF